MALNLFAPNPGKTDSLVEFKAGKMILEGKMCRPDKRKGLVQVKAAEDGNNYVHFVWKERLTDQVENDLIIFPNDASFRKVKESNARVYLLEFKDSSKKLFFWMQDLSEEKDEEHCTNINKYFAEPPQPGASGGDYNGLDREQLLQLLAQTQGGANLRNLQAPSRRPPGNSTPPRSAAPTRTAPSAAANPPAASSGSSQTTQQKTDNIRAILSGLQTAATQAEKAPQLNEVLNVDDIIASGLFENEAVVKLLAEFLPEGSPVTAENMKEHIRSAQFQQAVTLFNQALRGGEMATIMTSFGVDASSIGPHATIEDFLHALQKQAKKESEKKDVTPNSDAK